MPESYDKDEVKGRLKFLDLLAHEGVEVRRSGPHFVARCPFHEERSGSFTVHAPEYDHGHCYGCGWNGDIFDFWAARHGVGFIDSLAACASLATVSPSAWGGFFRQQQQASHPPAAHPGVTRVEDAPRDNKQKPALPRLRGLRGEEIEALSRLRRLDAAALALAADGKRIGACEWPQFIDRDGCWRRAKDAVPCWFITDAERRVIQYRRLDGEKFVTKDGKAIKAWTKGSPTWPVGASEIGDRVAVLLCEGGPDMLAAYHFLHLFHRMEQVAVCGMMGASCAIAEEALPFFRRKRVRIPMHVDEPNRKTGKVPAFEAAARWTAQLTAVGASVESYSLSGLVQKDGSPVEDLNDLAKADEAAWLDPELKALFFDFDF